VGTKVGMEWMKKSHQVKASSLVLCVVNKWARKWGWKDGMNEWSPIKWPKAAYFCVWFNKWARKWGWKDGMNEEVPSSEAKQAYFCVWGLLSGHESGDGISDCEMRWMKSQQLTQPAYRVWFNKWAPKWGWIIGLWNEVNKVGTTWPNQLEG
jgi:hypothetical protein